MATVAEARYQPLLEKIIDMIFQLRMQSQDVQDQLQTGAAASVQPKVDNLEIKTNEIEDRLKELTNFVYEKDALEKSYVENKLTEIGFQELQAVAQQTAERYAALQAASLQEGGGNNENPQLEAEARSAAEAAQRIEALAQESQRAMQAVAQAQQALSEAQSRANNPDGMDDDEVTSIEAELQRAIEERNNIRQQTSNAAATVRAAATAVEQAEGPRRSARLANQPAGPFNRTDG